MIEGTAMKLATRSELNSFEGDVAVPISYVCWDKF